MFMDSTKKFNFKGILIAFLCLLLAASFFTKGLYNDDLFIIFMLFITPLFLLFLFEQYKTGQGSFFSHNLDWAMLALLMAFSLSLINAVEIRSAIIGLMRFTACVFIFWMCYRASLQHSGYKAVLYSFHLTGVIMVIFAVLAYCGIVPYHSVVVDRLTGNFDYPNTFGAFAGIIFLLGWGLVLSTQNKVARTFVSGGNALLLLAILGSLSRGAWMLFPVAVITYFILIKREHRLNALLALIIAAIPGVLNAILLLSSGPKTLSFFYLILCLVLAAGLQLTVDRINLTGKINSIPKKLLLAVAGVFLVLVLCSVLLVPSVKTTLQGSLGRLANISLQDKNVQYRIEFSHDALKIVRDHPLVGVGSGGWNVVYHQYAKHLYWTDKPHNYFLQTWAENGTIGFLALIAIWLFFCQLLWKHRKRKDDDESALFWGAAVACFYLGSHSLIDFDMSYGAIAFLLFGLIGALKGRADINANELVSMASTHSEKEKKKRKQKQDQMSLWKGKVIPGMTIASVVAFALFVYAACLITARINYLKALDIIDQNPTQGIVYLNKAIEFDSLNAYYWNTAASFYVAVFKATHNVAFLNLAIADCKNAEKLCPYTIPVLNDINKCYDQLGEYDLCIGVADKLTRINPWDPNGYCSLANTQVMGGLSSMIKKQQVKQADEYWLAATKVIDRVPADIEVPPIGLNYTTGEALLLLGKKDEGELYLQKMLIASTEDTRPMYIEQVDTFRKNARLWLIASFENSGNIDEAKILMDQISSADQAEAKIHVDRYKSYISTAASLRAKNR